MKDYPMHKCFFNPNTHEKLIIKKMSKHKQKERKKNHNLLNWCYGK